MARSSLLISVLAAGLTLLAACGSPAPAFRPAPFALSAQGTAPLIDDSDISAPVRVNQWPLLEQEVRQREGEQWVFRAVPLSRQGVRAYTSNRLEVRGQFQYYDVYGQLLPAAQARVALYQGGRKIAQALTNAEGYWVIPVPAQGSYQVRYLLANPRWSIEKYSWEGPVLQVQGALDTGSWTLEKGTKNAEAGYIHEIYNRALRLFEREQMDLSWWQTPIKTVWPGSGDYYSSYTVNLTGAQQWDVNGHEIGHAIYDQALNARSTGGQHKIDACYNGTLAFSEGFATFFSGAVNLERSDADARFGAFLVPRRAPVQIENTPADVCAGNRNEWRVASVLWDVYDTHGDGADQLSLSLKEIFLSFAQANKPAIGSALDAYQLLRERLPVEDRPALKALFLQNTMEVKD